MPTKTSITPLTVTLSIIVTLFIIFSNTTEAATCHQITSSNQTPQGYASPVSYFTNDLMVRGDCDNGNINVSVGNGSGLTYVYNTSYEWNGSSWQPVTLTGQDQQGVWYTGTAQGQYSSTDNPSWYVAYTCEWINNAWKCGCSTPACTQSQWQVQAMVPPQPPADPGGGQSGGGGGYVSAGDWQGEIVNLCYPSPGNTINVSNGSALQNALNNASPGDRIVVSGNIGGNYTVSKSGTEGNPIVITGGGTARVDRFTLEGRYIVVEGFNLKGAQLLNSHNRITRNRLSGGILTRGSYHRVDRNEITGVRGPAIDVRVTGGAQNNRSVRVDHNYIRNMAGSGNGNEPMRTLFDAYGDTKTVFEYNLMDNVDVEREGEAISIKSSSNLIRGNTLLNSPISGITLRFGSRSHVIGNWLENSQGIRVFGDNHHIVGNVARNAGILLHGGNGTMDDRQCPNIAVPTKNEASCDANKVSPVHPATRNSIITDNIVTGGSIVVGANYSSQSGTAQNNYLARNNADIVRQSESGTREEGGSPQNNTAFKLTPSQVGVNAPDADCQ